MFDWLTDALDVTTFLGAGETTVARRQTAALPQALPLGDLAGPAIAPPKRDDVASATTALDAYVQAPPANEEAKVDPAAQKTAGELGKAMDGLGTDEDAIFKALKGKSKKEIDDIKAAYQKANGVSLDEAIKDELSGTDLSRATALMNPETGAPAVGKDGKKLDPEAIGKSANELFKAMDGIGTDEKAIFKTLQGKSPAEIAAIKAEYKKAKGRDLDTDIGDELSGDDKKRAEALLKGDNHEAALMALKDAKALVGTTDPEKVKEALSVLPNPADIKDPKEREKAVEERRKLLKDAGIDSGTEEAKGVAATAAKYALIGSIIPGVGTVLGGIVGGIVGAVEGDKDAKQNNKMLEAVIAGDDDKLAGEQIEKELHGGLFGHGGILGIGLGRDEGKIESSLENARDPKKVAEAYKAATGKDLKEDLSNKLSGDDKDVTTAMLDTHDKDPAKAAAARAQVAAAKIHRAKDGAGTDEDGIYKQLEGARSDAERKAIVKAYNEKYKDKEGMDFDSMLKDELSGNDLKKAQQLEEKGKMDPAFALKYAMDGAGTDTKLIIDTFKGKSKKEVDDIIAKYDKDNAPRTFKEDMKGELKISGRDGFDIKQALEGDPEAIKDPTERAKAKIARANEAYDFERGSGAGILTKGVDIFSDSGRVMDEHHEEMAQLGEKLKTGKPLSAEDQKQLNELTRYAKDDQEDFRAARDSVSNTAATATSAVVAATVGVLIEVATAGAATPALIAAASALAGGAASMGMKYAVQGASYGNDQIATDAAMTLIQTATAGFGQTGKFMEIAGKIPGLKELAKSKVGQEMLKQAFMNAIGQGSGALMNQDTYRGEGNGALKVLGAFGSGAMSGAVTGAILGGQNARFGSGYLAGALGGAAAGVVQTAIEVGANPDEEWGGKLATNLFTNVSGGLISAAGHQARQKQEAAKAAAAEAPAAGKLAPTEAMPALEPATRSAGGEPELPAVASPHDLGDRAFTDAERQAMARFAAENPGMIDPAHFGGASEPEGPASVKPSREEPAPGMEPLPKEKWPSVESFREKEQLLPGEAEHIKAENEAAEKAREARKAGKAAAEEPATRSATKEGEPAPAKKAENKRAFEELSTQAQKEAFEGPGPDRAIPDQAEVARVVNKARKDMSSLTPAEMDLIMKQVAYGARKAMWETHLANAAKNGPEAYQQAMHKDIFKPGPMGGYCGEGQAATSYYLKELIPGAKVYPLQMAQAFGPAAAAHSIMVCEIGGQKFLVDTTVAQFYDSAATGKGGAGSYGMRTPEGGAAVMDQLKQSGFVPLNEHTAAVYGEAIGGKTGVRPEDFIPSEKNGVQSMPLDFQRDKLALPKVDLGTPEWAAENGVPYYPPNAPLPSYPLE